MKKRTMKQKAKRNLRMYYVYRVFCTLNFIMPIFMLFLIDKGLTSFQIFVTQAAYTLTELFLTVPSGAFADKVGRKKTLILSTIFFAAAFAAYSYAETFTHILLIEMVFALSSALFHGTGEAFLYDTLAEAGQQKRYKSVMGTAYAIQSFMMAMASVTGGYMAKHSLALPFLATAVPVSLSLIPLFFLDEPKRKKVKKKESYWKLIKEASIYVARHKRLRNVMYYVAASTLAGYMGFMLLQPLLTNMGMKVEHLGWTIMVVSLVYGIGNKLAGRFESRLKRFNLWSTLAGTKGMMYLLIYMASGYYLLVWALVIELVSGVSSTLIADKVNAYSRSKDRATVLSISMMSGTLAFSVFSPLLGLYVDAYSEQACFLLLGIVMGGYALRQLAVRMFARVTA